MVTNTRKLHRTYKAIARDYGEGVALINAFHSKFYIKNMPKYRNSVLDIGCGTGNILMEVAKYFHYSFGIDPIEKFVATARLASPTSTVQVGNAEKIPYENDSMDYVISHAVFQHVDREQALDEIVRILKPNGRLIIGEVSSKTERKNLTVTNIYRRLRLDFYMLRKHGFKQMRQAKAFNVSSVWRDLTAIHMSRRLTQRQMHEFYSARLPGVKFKQLDSKIIAVIWDKK